jgi:peptidoglycan hydrolase-like protein with peptidoglycan-binding domain
METLAYLHLALAYEVPVDATEGYSLDNLRGFEWFREQRLDKHVRLYLLSLVVMASIWGMASEVLAQSPVRLGDRNPQVTFIQERLRQLRYLDQPADGVYSETTRDAVIRFQQDNNLNPDGVVGSETESALFAEFSQRRETPDRDFSTAVRPNRVLQQGDRGSDVTAVQRRLQELRYFDGQLTGYYGSATREAVIRFQVDNDIEADGIVGTRTREALFGSSTSKYYPNNSWRVLPSSSPSQEFSDEGLGSVQVSYAQVLQPGSRGLEVEELQRELRRRGFNPGSIDGSYGLQTQEAVRRFQDSRGLFADGVAGSRTLEALGLIARARENRYVVVVPVQNDNTLARVQAVVENAFEDKSRRGGYVNAGAFPNRARAESRSYLLRSRGLDARVAYSP